MPARMLDLRTPDGNLDALAPFRILAAMCHPEDVTARQHMLNLLKSETGAGAVRGKKTTSAEFLDQVRGCDGRLAGALLLNLLQLDGNGRRPSLNDAIRMVQSLLDSWETPNGPEWRSFDWTGHLSRRRSVLLKVFNDYLSVSHLWAALVHAGEHQRDDIWPGNMATLPRFLAYAETFADMAAQVLWSGADRRYLLPPNAPWRFLLPEHLREKVDLRALRLEPEQISALNTPSP